MAEEQEIEMTFEELSKIEQSFDDVDTQILRTQYELQKPLFASRTEAVAKIPKFWALVFEAAPPEIDQYIQTEDSRIFAEHLESIDVTRPELDADGKKGNPRSVKITFNFSPNEDFENTQLVKEFWWRRASDQWTGLVSEPVQIKWKKDKDLTNGLTDMAWNLFEARKKTGDMKNKGLPEYTKLKKACESWNIRNTSFFTWFGWCGDRRYVSAEESQEANEKFEKGTAEVPEDDDDDEPDFEQFDDVVEATDEGEDLTLSISDELWPQAIKFFTSSHETDDMSDAEDFEDDISDLDDEGPVDIRALVSKKGKDADGPPAKKQKK